jgi:pimeloyl-ACP methyl ester carboxylesterase
VEVGPGRRDALVDSPDGVVVHGAEPGAEVTIETRVRSGGLGWTCRGVFTADAAGTVDTATAPSTGADYLGTDPFGLVWSASPAERPDRSRLEPMRVDVVATSGRDRAETTYERAWTTPDVRVVDVSEDGVVGRLHLPTGHDLPGLVVVGGSDGGLGGPTTAALLSGHGVAALSLAYWNHPGTPAVLRDIDIEVVARACDWLRGQHGVRDARPTVLGISRGGELAMLAGALMPDRVGSVVSQVGSALVWGGFGDGVDDNDTAWRFGGRAVPQMWEYPDDSDRGLDDPALVAAAEIPVERVDGRVLLTSGEDDRIWRSTRLSEYAVRRAARHGAADRVEHISYPDAGHACSAPPGYAVPIESAHPVTGETDSLGGTLAGNNAARIDSWRRLQDLIGV